MVALGDFTGGDFRSSARATAADGSVIVGWGETASGSEAFRWTASQGMAGLGHLPGGGMFGGASAVTPDGAVIVGVSDSSSGVFAFRWTPDGGMTSVGDLSGGGVYSYANAVSADGSVVIGASDDGTFNRAFIWDAAHGMRNLRDVLVTDYGLPVDGWTLQEASGISADGRTIVGMGKNPFGQSEAWVVTIPEPSTFFLLLGAATAWLRRGRRGRRTQLWRVEAAVDDDGAEPPASASARTPTSRRGVGESRVPQVAVSLAALLGIAHVSYGATLFVYWNGNPVTGAPSVAIGNQYSSAPNLTILRPGSYRVYSVIDSTTPGNIGDIVVDYESGYPGSMDLQIWKDGVTPGAHDVASVDASVTTYSSVGNL